MSHQNRCLSCMAPLSGASACPACGAQPGSEPDNPLYLPAGCLLNNRYLIGRVIGIGGFGIVYLAWDNNLDIKVAIKEYLPKEYAARASDHLSLTPYTGNAKDEYGFGMEKFLDEAKALAKFQDHVGIVTVYESFRANNTAYMVMQYLDGITLKEFLKRQPGERISFEIAVQALTPIMDALREVHSAGYVHRDISPDNIFITRQKQVKLLDFGAARYAIGEHSKSLTTVLKHGYAPKEQYSTKGNQGPWTDVYAVAATLYRCITGQVPPDAMERMQESDTIMSPKQLGITVPLQAELALMKGLALKASDRFENIRDFQAALKGAAPVNASKPPETDLIEPRRPVDIKVVECPECGAKNQLQPGDDPGALRCGKCRRELGVARLPDEKILLCSKCGKQNKFDGEEIKKIGNIRASYVCTHCSHKNYFNDHQLATTGQRVSNLILDFIFYMIFAFVVGLVLAFAGLGNILTEMNDNVLGAIIYLVYYTSLEMYSGKTIGKMITGTKAVSEDGSSLTLGQCIGRSLCRFIPFEVFSFLGGSGTPSGWHDKIPKTKVITTR